MTNEELVDLDQLNLVANSDPDDCNFLVSIYLKATENDLTLLKNAIESQSVSDVYRIAHGCAGASLSYGMSAMVPVLRDLEREALSGHLENAGRYFEEAEAQFHRLQTYLMTLPTFCVQEKAA